jgi:hypothetical protein
MIVITRDFCPLTNNSREILPNQPTMLISIATMCAALAVQGTPQAVCQTRVPSVVDRVVTIPHALPAAISDRLAKEAKGVIEADGRGTLSLDIEAAEMLVTLGLTSTMVSEVNIRIETEEDRWGAHVDMPLPGTPQEYKHTAIIYVTESDGALHFPTTNQTVPFTKGGECSFFLSQPFECIHYTCCCSSVVDLLLLSRNDFSLRWIVRRTLLALLALFRHVHC